MYNKRKTKELEFILDVLFDLLIFAHFCNGDHSKGKGNGRNTKNGESCFPYPIYIYLADCKGKNPAQTEKNQGKADKIAIRVHKLSLPNIKGL